jgi:hypothetical protein
MSYAKLLNGQVDQYPLTEADLTAQGIDPAALPADYVLVLPSPVPPHHRLELAVEGIPSLTGTEWRQTWTVVNYPGTLPAQESADLLGALKAEKITLIRAKAVAERNRFIGDTSAYEAASWPIKMSEAKTFQVTGNPGDAPMLSVEASAATTPLALLCQEVLNRAALLMGLEGVIAGTMQRHIAAVNALNDHIAVVDYDFFEGWPT